MDSLPLCEHIYPASLDSTVSLFAFPVSTTAPSHISDSIQGWWRCWGTGKPSLCLRGPHPSSCLEGFHGGWAVKNPSANAREMDSIPGSERSPRGRNGNPFQYSCLENSTDRGTWWATVHRVTKSWTRLKQLSMPADSIHNWTPLRLLHKLLKFWWVVWEIYLVLWPNKANLICKALCLLKLPPPNLQWFASFFPCSPSKGTSFE